MVLASLLDLLIEFFHVNIGVNASVLRAFRLLRVFKLARSWKGLQGILKCMLLSLSQLYNLFLLLALLIFIFALLGMQARLTRPPSAARRPPHPRARRP